MPLDVRNFGAAKEVRVLPAVELKLILTPWPLTPVGAPPLAAVSHFVAPVIRSTSAFTLVSSGSVNVVTVADWVPAAEPFAIVTVQRTNAPGMALGDVVRL